MSLAVFAWSQVRGDVAMFGVSAPNPVAVFCATTLAVVALSLTCGPSARRLVLVASTALGLGLLAVTVVLSGNVLSLVMAALLLLSSCQLGAWLLGSTGHGHAGVALVALAAGYAVLMTALFIVGVLGLLWWWLIVVPIAALGLLSAWHLTARARISGVTARSVWAAAASRISRVEVMVVSVGMLAVGAVSIWTAAPEVQFDALWGKEGLPAGWAEAGRIVADPRDAQTFLGGGTLYVAVAGHLVGADAVGRYLALFTGVILAAAGWRVLRPRAGRALASCSALVFLVTPHVVWQMGTANDDLQLCLAAGALALAAVLFTRGSWSEALILGVLVGGALSGKLHLLPFAGVVAVAWFAVSGRRGGIRSLGALIAGATTIVAPWFIYRWIEAGNPVFPGLNNIFESPWWPPVNESFNLPYETTGALSGLLQLPVIVFAEPTRFMEAIPRGAFGLLPLLLLGFLFFGWAQGPSGRRIVWLATVVAVIAWWVQLRYLRYLLPYGYVALLFAGAPLAVLRAWSPARLRRWGRPLIVAGLSLVVMASAGTAAATFWNIPERVPLAPALGMESANEYRARLMPGAPAIEAINRITPRGSRIVTDGLVIYQRSLTEGGRYLLPAWEMNGLITWLKDSGQSSWGVTDPRSWRDLDIRWAAVGVGDFDGRGAVGPLGELIDRAGKPIWTDGRAALYRLPSR